MILTPFVSTIFSGWEPSTLPPASTAISTITLPVFMLFTMAAEISFGAGFPGISAAVTMISEAATVAAIFSA